MTTEKNEFDQPVGFKIENWAPVKRPPGITLQGQYCTLELTNIDQHAVPLFEAFSQNDSSWTYLSGGPFKNLEEFQTWFKKIVSDPDCIFYTILDPKTRLPIGVTAYLRIVPDHGVIEVGHLHFSNALKQTPAATEAMYLMMKHVFDDLGYRRYEWKCNNLNEASKNAALRLGFKFEGIFRQLLVAKGHNRDTAWFSIIDNEWPELKKRFERWLNPDNFDAQGKQVKRLGEV